MGGLTITPTLTTTGSNYCTPPAMSYWTTSPGRQHSYSRCLDFSGHLSRADPGY